MARKLKKCSGKDCVKILHKHFNFIILRQKGSHVILRKENTATVVPLHKELKLGTLKGILKLAKVAEVDFIKHQ